MKRFSWLMLFIFLIGGAWSQAEDYCRARFQGPHLVFALAELEQARAAANAAAGSDHSRLWCTSQATRVPSRRVKHLPVKYPEVNPRRPL